MKIKTRIAPSPTGYLHIGTARTALFNYLFAKQNNGTFHLRVEDTDLARNTKEAYDSITNGLEWLGLKWDEKIVYQKDRFDIHLKYAQELIKNGLAYYSFLSQEELEERKEKARKSETFYMHRYSKEDEIQNGQKPVIRLKVNPNLDIKFIDLVQGEVTISSNTIDDFIIVRSSGEPVYMFSCVCDDFEMEMTHIIRGDDHLTNTAKQILIYEALGAKIPFFAHIPLIHDNEGKKLSKRKGAASIEEYKQMGYLPESLRSYLLRLGWGSKDDTILDDQSAIKNFSLEGIVKSPARFDFEKLDNINSFFIKQKPSNELLKLMEINNLEDTKRAIRAIDFFKNRTKTLNELKSSVSIFFEHFSKTQNLDETKTSLIKEFISYKTLTNDFFKQFLETKKLKFGDIGPTFRQMLIGDKTNIGVFEITKILGDEESIKRISSY